VTKHFSESLMVSFWADQIYRF